MMLVQKITSLTGIICIVCGVFFVVSGYNTDHLPEFAWLEQEGVCVMEAESLQYFNDNWRFETSPAGFTGGGFLWYVGESHSGIDLSWLPNGMWIAVARRNGRILQTHRFVIRK
jgi:hypothetical protein